MKPRRIQRCHGNTLLLLLALAVPLHRGLAQEVARDTISAPRMVRYLQYQYHTMAAVALVNARAHGQSAKELGDAFGVVLSPRWGSHLDPEEFGRAVVFGLNRMGFRTALLHESNGQAEFTWSLPDSVAFAHAYTASGVTAKDVEVFMTAMLVRVAELGGLRWEQQRHDTVFTVVLTRKP